MVMTFTIDGRYARFFSWCIPIMLAVVAEHMIWAFNTSTVNPTGPRGPAPGDHPGETSPASG